MKSCTKGAYSSKIDKIRILSCQQTATESKRKFGELSVGRFLTFGIDKLTALEEITDCLIRVLVDKIKELDKITDDFPGRNMRIGPDAGKFLTNERNAVFLGHFIVIFIEQAVDLRQFSVKMSSSSGVRG